MTHPYFENIPDEHLAAVLSEAFEDDYTHASQTAFLEHGAEAGFPPVPAYLAGMSVAYIDKDGESLRRVGAFGLSGTAMNPDTKELTKAYKKNVVNLQSLSRDIEKEWAPTIGMEISNLNPTLGRIGQWCLEKTKESGRNLVAAHLVFVEPNEMKVYDALAYSKHVKNEFTFLLRDYLAPIILGGTPSGDEEVDADLQSPDSHLRALLRKDPSSEEIAAIPASRAMPTLGAFRKGLKLHGQQGR